MAQRVVRRRPLPAGVREIPNRNPIPVREEPIRSQELTFVSPAAGQPAAQTIYLPPRSKVVAVGYVTEVTWPTTTTLLDFGDQATADRFYADKNVDPEGSDYTQVAPGVLYPNGQTLTAQITTTGSTSTGGKTRVRVYYQEVM